MGIYLPQYIKGYHGDRPHSMVYYKLALTITITKSSNTITTIDKKGLVYT